MAPYNNEADLAAGLAESSQGRGGLQALLRFQSSQALVVVC